METIEICSGNLCIDVEVIHRDNGSYSGDVKIKYKDFNQQQAIKTIISKNFFGRLTLKNPHPKLSNELVYEDRNYAHDNFGVDKKEHFNLSNPNNVERFSIELSRLVSAFLDD